MEYHAWIWQYVDQLPPFLYYMLHCFTKEIKNANLIQSLVQQHSSMKPSSCHHKELWYIMVLKWMYWETVTAGSLHAEGYVTCET